MELFKNMAKMQKTYKQEYVCTSMGSKPDYRSSQSSVVPAPHDYLQV